MARDELLWAGNNRGADTIERQLMPKTLNRYAPTLLLADPKEIRAAHLAEALRNKLPTLTPQPLQMRVQDALAKYPHVSAAVLTVDTMDATTEALNARRPSQWMSFQIVGKGPGGVTATLLGLQGTISPGDHVTRESVQLLLPALAEMSRAASSRDLAGPDRVTAAVLQPLRQVVSRKTVAHLGEKERAPQDLTGVLSVWPLVRPCFHCWRLKQEGRTNSRSSLPLPWKWPGHCLKTLSLPAVSPPPLLLSRLCSPAPSTSCGLL